VSQLDLAELVAKCGRGDDGRSRRAGAGDAAGDEGSLRGWPAVVFRAREVLLLHRTRRPDALDPETGERLDDVLVFRVDDLEVKELLLADDRGAFFTTPHWDGYAAVLVRIRDLGLLDRDELRDLVVDAWLTRAQKRVAKAWLNENEREDRSA